MQNIAKDFSYCGMFENASVLKWSTRADCKSADFGLRWFESNLAHSLGRIEAKASVRPFASRVLSSSNASISGVRSFSPFLRTENQECRSIKSFLDSRRWFEPKLENISLCVCILLLSALGLTVRFDDSLIKPFLRTNDRNVVPAYFNAFCVSLTRSCGKLISQVFKVQPQPSFVSHTKVFFTIQFSII